MFYENTAMHACDAQLCEQNSHLAAYRRDERSGVLIGAGGMRRPDWPERMKAVGVHARSDRQHACKDKSTHSEYEQCYIL